MEWVFVILIGLILGLLRVIFGSSSSSNSSKIETAYLIFGVRLDGTYPDSPEEIQRKISTVIGSVDDSRKEGLKQLAEKLFGDAQ